jgi:hypothetical protein
MKTWFKFFIICLLCSSASFAQDTLRIPSSPLELDSMDFSELKKDSLKQEVIDNFLCCGYRNKIISTFNNSLKENGVDRSNFVSRNVLLVLIIDSTGRIKDLQYPTAQKDVLKSLNSIKKELLLAFNSRTNFDATYVDDALKEKVVDRILLIMKFDLNGDLCGLETKGNRN